MKSYPLRRSKSFEAMTVPSQPPEEDVKTPISFKLMVGLAVLYLGWRFVQGIFWLIQRTF